MSRERPIVGRPDRQSFRQIVIPRFFTILLFLYKIWTNQISEQMNNFFF